MTPPILNDSTSSSRAPTVPDARITGVAAVSLIGATRTGLAIASVAGGAGAFAHAATRAPAPPRSSQLPRHMLMLLVAVARSSSTSLAAYVNASVRR